jgi:hypothetical protein
MAKTKPPIDPPEWFPLKNNTHTALPVSEAECAECGMRGQHKLACSKRAYMEPPGSGSAFAVRRAERELT